ncbi:hypothetical protein PK28_17430 (plasmid) [Hymenobacter sp. DG25B]|uniref:hypothetical protein n=1 Tax=Hymenobacter sp. DG25B TaxID=1385664 RepID=UPI000540EA26|nr:hypothetical protein [Hymenobacter sp. DG25B]AIZ65451.1 hypothetical protein PK28_17430 [Hymenobacter sp. DG25B]
MAIPIQNPKIPTRRGPIPVSEEARSQARANMGGEQVKTVLPVPAEAPAAAPAPTAAPTVAPAPAATAPAPAQKAPVAARRGRKPAPPEAVPMETERSVKIPESVWDEIRLALVLLPKGQDSPASIKAYLVAAHRVYDASLRKAGKLPPVK